MKPARRPPALAPASRALAMFLLLNGLALNGALAVLPWTPRHKTGLSYTARTVLLNAGNDSWSQMATALEEFRAHPELPLYQHVFFGRHIRFPYPPTALLLMDATEHLGLGFRFLNLVSWIAVMATAALVGALLTRELEGADAGETHRSVLFVLALGYTLTFYPIVKGFALGQIQTWINLLLGGVLWLWGSGRQRGAGILAAGATLLKPHYGLLLLWAASRRRWGFCGSFGGIMLFAGVISVLVFGVVNHLDYAWMLAYVSRHGESYFANNSWNGLLQRLVFNGENLTWHENRYPPVNAVVLGGSLVASAVLVSFCLLWRRRAVDAGGRTDLMIAMLTCVMASPVAWEHHYGILLPIYAIAFPVALRRSDAAVVWLGLSYVLTGTYLGVTKLAADTWLNVVQSSLLFGATMVLLLLYRLRMEPPPCRC